MGRAPSARCEKRSPPPACGWGFRVAQVTAPPRPALLSHPITPLTAGYCRRPPTDDPHTAISPSAPPPTTDPQPPSSPDRSPPASDDRGDTPCASPVPGSAPRPPARRPLPPHYARPPRRAPRPNSSTTPPAPTARHRSPVGQSLSAPDATDPPPRPGVPPVTTSRHGGGVFHRRCLRSADKPARHVKSVPSAAIASPARKTQKPPAAVMLFLHRRPRQPFVQSILPDPSPGPDHPWPPGPNGGGGDCAAHSRCDTVTPPAPR